MFCVYGFQIMLPVLFRNLRCSYSMNYDKNDVLEIYLTQKEKENEAKKGGNKVEKEKKRRNE